MSDKIEIPDQVKKSIYELAYANEVGNSLLSPISQKVKRKKAGSVEIEYADNSSSTTINRAVSSSIKKLLANGSGGYSFGVVRV